MTSPPCAQERRSCLAAGLAGLWLALAPRPGRAEPAPKFAALSLLGDQLQLVTHRAPAGGHLPRNFYEPLAVGEVLDTTALKALDEGLRQLRPEAAPTLLSVAAEPPGTPPRDWLDGDRFLPTDALKDALAQSQATQLLLVLKLKAEAHLNAHQMQVGHGPVEGVGFYIDRSQRLRRSDTGAIGVGFLAPFAYFRVLLIDVASASVLQRHIVKASSTLSAARAEDSANPWDALNAEQKLRGVRAMIHREVLRAVPLLFKEAS
jgi:hypothetical protein